MRIMVINGPNLNMLGSRETSIYGTTSLSDIEASVKQRAILKNMEVIFFQSNHEGELIDAIQKAHSQGIKAFIINPGGYTHTSVALRDALLAVSIPFIEVHLSKVSARESFRQVNYFSDIASGTISGFGPESYNLAIEALWELYGKKAE